eukprot:SAG22_NODE_2440_length_2574_cov_1.188283_1_plen_400_part_10
MLLLSSGRGNRTVIRLFPVWRHAAGAGSATFAGLRAKGAFVLSASYDNVTDEVSGVVVTSDAGRRCAMVSPWVHASSAGTVIVEEAAGGDGGGGSGGNDVQVTWWATPAGGGGPVFEFATTAGVSYRIFPTATAAAVAAAAPAAVHVALKLDDVDDAAAVSSTSDLLQDALLLGRRARDGFQKQLSGETEDTNRLLDDQQPASSWSDDVCNLFLLLGLTTNLAVMIPLYMQSARSGVFVRKRSLSLCTVLEAHKFAARVIFVPNLLVNLLLPIFVKAVQRCITWARGLESVSSSGTSSNLVVGFLRHPCLPLCMLITLCVGLFLVFTTDTVTQRAAHMRGAYLAALSGGLLYSSVGAETTVRGAVLLCAGFATGLVLCFVGKRIKDRNGGREAGFVESTD